MGLPDTELRLAAEKACASFMASLKHNKKMMYICSRLVPRSHTTSYILEVTEHMYNHRLASTLKQALGNILQKLANQLQSEQILASLPSEICCGMHLYCIQTFHFVIAEQSANSFTITVSFKIDPRKPLICMQHTK